MLVWLLGWHLWEEPYPESCGEDGRGWWSTSFAGQMLFYDPADLAAVAAGTLESWEPQPYAVLDLDSFLYHIQAEQQLFHVGAAAFDRDHDLLYVLEPFADGDKPVVHVWRGRGVGEESRASRSDCRRWRR